MITRPDLPDLFPPPPPILPLAGGLQFKDAAPMICGVVDNGVPEDDPRVMVRLNEATKMVLDYMIPVGGMMICNITAINRLLICPPQMENIIEAHPADGITKVYGDNDVTQSWYEVTNNSMYMEPEQSYDNPLTDLGLNGDPGNTEDVRRVYFYPGLEPGNAVIQCTGAKRFRPITNDEDYLIVQNIEAIKLLILSIERNENASPDEAIKYKQQALELLQAEVKKHIFDPRNFMFRKAGYMQDLTTFTPNSMGWMRAQIALDIPDGLRMGKNDITWTVNQAERRIMERGTWKDTVVNISATVVGGNLYFPMSVETVLAIDICGRPIPIRSRFFPYLDNGPGGGGTCSEMLIDKGDVLQPGFAAPRRKYRLNANCTEGQCITAVCKLRWIMKKPGDMMTIKNYEALRLMTTAKVLEGKEDWQNAGVNQQLAIDIMDKELKAYLGGIRHTVHIQTHGFGLGDVGLR